MVLAPAPGFGTPAPVGADRAGPPAISDFFSVDWQCIVPGHFRMAEAEAQPELVAGGNRVWQCDCCLHLSPAVVWYHSSEGEGT